MYNYTVDCYETKREILRFSEKCQKDLIKRKLSL